MTAPLSRCRSPRRLVALIALLVIHLVDARTTTKTLLLDASGATDAPPYANNTNNESESPMRRTMTKSLMVDLSERNDTTTTTTPDTEAPPSTDVALSSTVAPTTEVPPSTAGEGTSTASPTELPTTEPSSTNGDAITTTLAPSTQSPTSSAMPSTSAPVTDAGTTVSPTAATSTTGSPTTIAATELSSTTIATTTETSAVTTAVPLPPPTTAAPLPPPTATPAPVTLPPGSTPVFRAVLRTGTTTAQFRSNVSVALGIPTATISIIATATVLFDPVTGATVRNVVSRRGFAPLSFLTTTEVNFTITGTGSAAAAATAALLNPSPALLVSLPTFGISAVFVATTATPPTTSYVPAPTTTLRPISDSAGINDQERATIIGISVSVGTVLLIATAVCLLKRMSDLAQARAAMFSKQQGAAMPMDERTAGGWQQLAAAGPPPPPPGAASTVVTGPPFSAQQHPPATAPWSQQASSGSQLDQSQYSSPRDGAQPQVPWRQNIPPPLQMPVPSNTSALQRQGSWTHHQQPSLQSTPRGPHQHHAEGFGGSSAPHSPDSSPQHGMQQSLDSSRRSSQLALQGSHPGSWVTQQPSPLVSQPYPQAQAMQWQRPQQQQQQQPPPQIPQPPPLQLSQRQNSFTSAPRGQPPQPSSTSAVTSWTPATTPQQSPRRWN